MKVLITAPLFALFSFVSLEDLAIPNDISGAKKEAKTRKCHTPVIPVVTIGYILHGFNFTTWDKLDPDFHGWQSKVLKKASAWLKDYAVKISLENTTVTKATSTLSAEIEKWKKKKGLVYPYEILDYLKEDIKTNTKYNPDIVILVTKVPLTLYTLGFGSYEPLCHDVVPMFLTYNKTSVIDTGDLLGEVILNSLNINNYNKWHRMPQKDRNYYFKNCVAQRLQEDYF
uniref:Putative 26 kDa salivary gland protein a n=1 Tax=Ixodes ricinus TaxID=34613 RepID=A0A147BUH2_IXORI